MSGYRVAMDIGGTFTDFVVVDEDAGTTSPASARRRRRTRSEGVLDGLAQVVPELARDLVPRPRHDGRPERVPRAQGHARAAADDRGPARRLLDRPPRPQGAVRAPLPQAASGSCRARDVVRGARAAALGRHGRDAARRGEPRAADRARSRGEGIEAVAVCLLHAYVNPEHELQRARAARSASSPAVGDALARDRPRVARVRARLDGGAERLRRAARRAATCGTLESELGERERLERRCT